MNKLLLTSIALLSLALAGTAAAGSSGLSIEKVSASTRDGGAWQPGQPVMVVFDVRGSEFPDAGLAVVMQVQKERTKCLDVSLRKVWEEGSSARYAGVFYPFYVAVFDGKVTFGGSEPQDFTFQIGSALPPSTVASSADVPAADPRAGAPPTLEEAVRASLPAALAALLLALVPLAVRLPRRSRA